MEHIENMISNSRTYREYHKVIVEHTENMISYSRIYRDYHKVVEDMEHIDSDREYEKL